MPRPASSPYLGDMLEYLRWANVMVKDHELLQRLLRRFECSDVPGERASLLSLALKFHRIHREFESAWMHMEQFEPRNLELDFLEQRLERATANSPDWNAAAAGWGEKALLLMNLEETCFDQRKIAGASMLGWTSQLLETRVALIGDIRLVLAAEDGERGFSGT